MQPTEPFWMVYGGGQSVPTVQHSSPELAREEAERLAAKHPGICFYVLGTIGKAQRIDVQYQTIHLDMIPF